MVKDIEIDEKFQLTEDNVLLIEPSEKQQITLCDTFRKGMGHYYYWLNRLDGKYKSTTPFTVDKNGTIYGHYDPSYTSVILGNKVLDTNNIYISLVNEGRLYEDNGKYFNWIGEEVDVEPFECRWRDSQLWSPYTYEQLKSVIKLCRYLCNEFSIDHKVMRSNTTYNYVDDYNGIAFKSNYGPMYKDINPSWFFSEFKKRIENGDQ